MKTLTRQPGLFEALIGDGRPLLSFLGWGLAVCGGFALFQSATGQFLPHDARYLGMTTEQLCAMHQCRIVHFMFHDRVALGGVLMALGMLYLWLAEFPLRRGEHWAWRAIAASGVVGFGSFAAFIGYGYLDVWHAVATGVLLVCFMVGLWLTRRGFIAKPMARTPRYRGWMWLLATGLGLAVAGLTIMFVGATVVFVPQDLKFMRVTPAELHALNPRLIPVIAHDRAAFGGALLSCGVAWVFCVWYGAPARGLWQALAVAGVTGFVAAVGIHLVVGYVDVSHLGPAIVGGVIFVTGLARAFRPMYRERQTAETKSSPMWVLAKET